MNELLLGNLRDAGLSPSNDNLKKAVDRLGEDEVNYLVTSFRASKERARDAKVHNARKAADVIYSKSYQRLVRAGLATQLKKKYR